LRISGLLTAHRKIAFAMLVLGTALMWNSNALAQTPAPPTPPTAPAPPTPPAAAPPSASQPQAPSTSHDPQSAAPAPVGSVATLQGGASVNRNQAAKPLAIRDSIFKGDVLQTAVDGTLGITFDDDTTFTLKPNSQIAVDDFVYQQGGASNVATFNVLRGTVAFVAAEVAHTGNMKIETPTSVLGIRGTTGLVEIPAPGTPAAATGVSVKLYADVDGRVGRIEVFGSDGGRLGLLDREATGFAIRAGAAGAAARFSATPLRISPEEATRDRGFVRQAFATRQIGHQMNVQRRTFQQRQQNLQRGNQLRPNNLQRPNQLRPNNLQRQPGPRPPAGQRRPPPPKKNGRQ
jgi:hypothetical protein